MAFPYTYYACPCSTVSASRNFAPTGNRRSSRALHASPHKRTASSSPVKRAPAPILPDEDADEGDEPFDPHDARANYSLHPLDSLLFCDECNQIRCPKCWLEEAINWYCPSCLFEVAGSVVRSDGNRCSRNCYQCPICTAPLAVTAYEAEKNSERDEDGGAEDLPRRTKTETRTEAGESYILQCLHCDWNSVQLGVVFSRQTKITEQLNKQRKERRKMKSKDSAEERGESEQIRRDSHQHMDHESTFEKLQSFYRSQLDEASDSVNPYGSSPYSSPANLARIMSMYGGLNPTSLKKSREKPQPMREALSMNEGLAIYTADDMPGEEEMLQKMRTLGWETTSASDQRTAPVNQGARFVDELWPVAVPLRVRRGKRCKTCRQFLARPEPKVSSFRYKIRLLALHHIPRLAIRPLNTTAARPEMPSFALKNEPVVETKLQPNVPQQFILTLRNPIFETVRISLATPAVTPGRVASRVTILCPTFTIGPAGDVWDDALSASDATRTADGGRKAAMASLTGTANVDRQPEAGKVWEKTRNSTSVILEIVPGSVQAGTHSAAGQIVDEHMEEDDDVLEIPILVRAEWEAEMHAHTDREAKGKERETKELSYWCVLRVGRIASLKEP